MTAPAKKTGARGNSKKAKPPTEHVALPKPEDAEADAKPSLYPEGVRLFTYQPEDPKAEPILLALDGFEPPDKLWLFDVAQLPMLSQTWAWMNRANIPKPIQRQAVSLPDSEYFKMFNAWFDVMKAANAPKGAVTAEK